MDDIENRILETAREAFIENGYTDTSMSDIAARLNINRPTLHYYFRTKDKLFQAVFGGILLSFVPRIKETVTQRQRSVGERVADIVDLYYMVFTDNPCLPSFVLREINRDVDHFVGTLEALHIDNYVQELKDSLQAEMNEGHIRQIPLCHLFYTFYGMLIVPFVTRPLVNKLYPIGDQLPELLEDWKKNIVSQITHMLEV
ncbi:MAG: TetR/AcrR family transcriptional regulator [Prevotella sp.]|nr:TetR/AcrR family transcriptional regulator [Prevotella sp.]